VARIEFAPNQSGISFKQLVEIKSLAPRDITNMVIRHCDTGVLLLDVEFVAPARELGG
jgi:hypothetical protein